MQEMGNSLANLRMAWKSPIATTLVLIVLTAVAMGAYVVPSFDPFLAAILAVAGMIAGCLYWNRWRGLGFVPFCYLFGTMFCIAASILGERFPCIHLAMLVLGIAVGRLIRDLFGRRNSRWFAWAMFCAAGMMLILTPPLSILRNQFEPEDIRTFAIVLSLLTVFAFLRLIRPAIELAVEPVLWLMYRVKRVGPAAVPAEGPCIVIANHACWLDPLFLAKVLQRPITPMMISRFYDVRFLRPLVKHVFHVIRVPQQHFKKQETPDEIREAIAALDRGECLLLFPEGFLRRSEEQPLRRFGRGIWQILSARPSTPVFCCWIEGGWGSWCSYRNGQPTKNKRPDIRRHIGVAVPAAITVDAELLSHHLATRLHLMNRVLESRSLLGLTALPPVVYAER
jgi:1-acyl-sn-glycerol-3-phosphate acyltransferase